MAKLITKLLFFLLLLFLSIKAYTNPTDWSLIGNVNLIFHEAGHVFLLPFGKFMHFLGGTLFEFGVPLSVLIYFFIKRQLFAAAFSAWWLSTAFLGISVYAGDALLRQLPLLGGESVNHDWNTMLLMLDWLRYYKEIAGIFYGLSLASLALAIYFVYLDIMLSLRYAKQDET